MSWDSDDQIAQLVLTGNEIYEVLESAAREPYRLLLMSGARVTYDATKPLGQRIVSVLVGDTKLIPGKMYTVACSYVLANGVGDYPILATKPRNVVAMTIGEIFANHIHAVETISPALDGRLEIIGQL